MRRLIRVTSLAAATAALLLGAPAALAHAEDAGGAQHAVFVQTNNPGGNAVVAYARHDDGTLTWAATYPTGGLGGRAAGAFSDPLATQAGLAYDPEDALLFALNAGSNSVSVFGVNGDRLALNQVVSSGGPFPASVAVRDDLVYVLDAGFAGAVQGYHIANGRLDPIADSSRSLGLGNANPPFFLSSPGQVGITPDGRQLIVTTKINGTVEAFGLDEDGRPSSSPTITALGGVPFAFVFNGAGDDEQGTGRLALINAATATVSTYQIGASGTLALVSASPSSGQGGACWITGAGKNAYVGNTGSGTISQFRVDATGSVTLVNPVAAAGIPGAIDMAASNGSQFLYAQSGASGTVQAFAIGPGGSLSLIGSVPVPGGASQEGIVAA